MVARTACLPPLSEVIDQWEMDRRTRRRCAGAGSRRRRVCASAFGPSEGKWPQPSLASFLGNRMRQDSRGRVVGHSQWLRSMSPVSHAGRCGGCRASDRLRTGVQPRCAS